MMFSLKKFSKKLPGKLSKNSLSFLGVFLIISLFGILVFSSSLTTGSKNEIQTSVQGLFIRPVKNFLRESPEMTLVQENSIKGISSPATITPQVLGSILGGIETGTETRREIIEYVVESGDTLSSIAEEFEITVNTISWANDLSSSMIKSGQELIILPVSGIVYFVKKDDTLGAIAETYKGKVDEIIAFNGLSNEGDIFIGDILIIPNGKMPSRIPYIASIPVGESYFSIFPCEGKMTQGRHYYNAIDVANSCGEPVVAVASGTVQRIKYGYNGGYGNYITILHPNGVVTLYAHLSKISVASGPVSAGEIIGYIGNTGRTIGATGCHLHFEVRPKSVRNFLANYLVGTYLSWK